MDQRVISPAHYATTLGIEVIDIIEEFYPHNFRMANVIKYVLRATKKEEYLEDLKKAKWYLDREISKEEKFQ